MSGRPRRGARRILVLDFDDRNEQHLARHQVTPRDIRQVVRGRHSVRWGHGRPNRAYVYGWTDGGRALTIVMDYIEDADAWRPVTAWDAPAADASYFPGKRI